MTNEKMILGDNCVYSRNSHETGLNNNVLVCGGSGSGKTMSISEPYMIETTDSTLIAAVTKRRIVTTYTPMYEERGYDIYDLNFAEPKKSTHAYDPLHHVHGYSDITFLAKSIVKSDPQKDKSSADPYWDQAGIALFSAEIAYVMMTMEHPTFSDVLDFHDNLVLKENREMVETNYDDKFAEIEKKDPRHFSVTQWRTFKNTPMRTAGCIYSALTAAIQNVFTPEIRKMIASRKPIDFEDIAVKKSAVFITTSAVNPALHSFVNMFYAQAFKSLFEFAEHQKDGKLPVPVHLLCDDFATGSRVLNFPEYISIFREKDISVTLLLQSESQLEQMYGPDNAATIINNCDTYVYLGGMDLRTAQNVSLRLNAPLEDVLYMPVGREVVFRRGQKPIRTSRYTITKNPVYRKYAEGYHKQIHIQER